MPKRWGLYGTHSRDFLTYGGRIIWHDNPAEMEWLTTGAQVREIPRDVPDELMMPLREHPKLAGVRWPLRREDFVRRRRTPA